MLDLRPYQTDAIRQVHDQFRAGNRRVCAVLPCGAGKRYMACWWAQNATQQGRRCMVVTNRRQLIFQMSDELKGLGIDHGVLMGEVARRDEAPVQVASIQTIRQRHLTYGRGLPAADLILIDEGHQETRCYSRLLVHYPKSLVVGLTATPVGTGGSSLQGVLYDTIVEGVRNSSLIAKNLLLRTKVYAPSEPDIKGVSSSRDEYNQSELGRRMAEVTTFANVFDTWRRHSQRKTICFAPGVAFARGLAMRFNQKFGAGTAEVISAETRRQARSTIFDAFESGDLKVLVSVDVLREGFDSPIASCAIDLQPNRQIRTYWQKVGRIKRAYEGQTSAVLLDLAGNYWRHPHPDTDPPWLEIGQGGRDVMADYRARTTPEDVVCVHCGALRPGGKVCPGCGKESTPQPGVRHMRMGSGVLKLVTPDAKKKKKASREQQAWDKARYRAAYSGKTFSFAAWLFKQQMGTWPSQRLRYHPGYESPDWQRPVIEVYPSMDKRSRKA